MEVFIYWDNNILSFTTVKEHNRVKLQQIEKKKVNMSLYNYLIEEI